MSVSGAESSDAGAPEGSVVVAPEAPPAGVTAIGPYSSERSLREATLVLSAMSIAHGVAHTSAGLHILVKDADYPKAARHLDRYEEENRDWPPRPQLERPRYAGFPFIALAFVALVVFSLVTGPAKSSAGPWFRDGASVATMVFGAEPFRAVTALTLHADAAHVLGNMLSGAVFGRAVERRLGPGAGGLAVLASGALGNVANAAFYLATSDEHRSIGASTAVFGAVGVLAATQLIFGFFGSAHAPGLPSFAGRAERGEPTSSSRRRFAPRRWWKIAVPVIGGLALLGTLGASPSSDVWAHAWGFAAGLVLGVPFALIARRTRQVRPIPQLALGVVAISIVAGSWALALA